MGASVNPGAAGAPPLRGDVMLDEIEKQMKEQEAADKVASDAAEAKAKADLEAKARADAAAAAPPDPRVKALEEALRISEEGRRRQEETLRSITPGAGKKTDETPELTREQLAELFEKEPLAAIEYLQTNAMKKLDESISRRLEPLVSGGATSAREMAKSKYPEEFIVLGPEIQAMLDDPRISKSAMNNIQAWDDLIAFIRGKPGNFEKLVEHRASKERGKAADDARAREAAAAGTHTRSDVRPPAPVVSGDLDDTEREIARTIHPDLTPEEAYTEYKRWRGVAK